MYILFLVSVFLRCNNFFFIYIKISFLGCARSWLSTNSLLLIQITLTSFSIRLFSRGFVLRCYTRFILISLVFLPLEIPLNGKFSKDFIPFFSYVPRISAVSFWFWKYSFQRVFFLEYPCSSDKLPEATCLVVPWRGWSWLATIFFLL